VAKDKPDREETLPPLTLSVEEREALARGHVMEEIAEQITQKLILSNIGVEHARALANEFRMMLYEHVLHCPWTVHADRFRNAVNRRISTMQTEMDEWRGGLRLLKWALPLLCSAGAVIGGAIVKLIWPH
jgi:hypothetical protein